MRKKTPIEDESDSKSRIMTAAVELFASKGVDKVSLRELTAQANVNIAAVNYHFGGKEALVEAVFETLAQEVNGARLAELERLLEAAAASGAVPDLERIVGIFMHPYVDPASRQKGGLLAQMILKNRLNSTPALARIVRDHFDPMARRFIEAIRLACPLVDPDEFYWRYMFMVSSIVLTVTDSSKTNRVARLSAGKADVDDTAQMAQVLGRFITGALRAPGPESATAISDSAPTPVIPPASSSASRLVRD